MDRPPACDEHLVIGVAIRGGLMCLDCGTEVVLERGIWASNWYATSTSEYFKKKKGVA